MHTSLALALSVSHFALSAFAAASMRSCSALLTLRVFTCCACAEAANATPTASAMLVMDSFIGTPWLRPSQQARDQRDQEKDHEHYEQDLGDLGRAGSDAGEAENRRDDGDDEKRERPAQHDRLLEVVGSSSRS